MYLKITGFKKKIYIYMHAYIELFCFCCYFDYDAAYHNLSVSLVFRLLCMY